MKRALQAILVISVFGVLFSGVLAYGELFGEAATTCPSPGPSGTVLGYPACIYGFFMYLAIAATASAGLLAARPSGRTADDSRSPRGPRTATPAEAPTRVEAR